jgi:hypothetical protein
MGAWVRWSIAVLSVSMFSAAMMLAYKHWRPGTFDCVSDHHDFGTIGLGEKGVKEHRFVLINNSSKPVNVRFVRSSCGCTVADAPSEPVQPGRSAEVVVRVDWSSRVGPHAETVQLATDDIARPTLLLTVTGKVQSMASVEPAAIDFGVVPLGQERTARVLLTGLAPETLPALTSITSTSDNISIIDRKITSKGGEFVVHLKAPMRAGAEAAVIRFPTDPNEMIILKVPVVARFEGAITADPSLMVFGPSTNQRTLKISSLRGLENLQFEWLWESSQPNPFQITGSRIESGGNSPTRLVEISVDPEVRGSQALHGKLRIRLNEEILDVPMTIGRAMTNVSSSDKDSGLE